MTTEDLKKLDAYLAEHMSGIAKENNGVIYNNETYLAHGLVHVILSLNEYDPKRIKKSMNKNMKNMDMKLLPHYRNLKQVLFSKFNNLPLFINDYFNIIAKWRLERSI